MFYKVLLMLQHLDGFGNQILVSVLAVCLWGQERTDWALGIRK